MKGVKRLTGIPSRGIFLILILSLSLMTVSCGGNAPSAETSAESASFSETKLPESTETSFHPETAPRETPASTEPLSPETEHQHHYTETVIAPTCTENGYTLYACECGESFHAQTVTAYGHIWDDGTIVKEPTENESGLARYRCLLCGESKETVLPNLTHTHEFHVSVVAATCLTEGYTLYLCDCGNSYRENVVSPIEHIWGDGKVTRAPTEYEAGLKVYTCKNCGDRKIEVLKKLPHQHHYQATVVTPTCTENGYTRYTCESCGTSYTERGDDALGHLFDEGIVTRAPTEYTTGILLRTCTRCGECVAEQIEKLPHTHRYLDQIIHPTCLAEGFTVHTCLCGESYIDHYTSALGHSFGEWFPVTEPTETAPGLAKRICSVCGKRETKMIPPLSEPDDLRDTLFALINEARASEDLPPLSYEEDFQSVVSDRSLELFESFSHTRPDGRSCFSIFDDIGFYAFTHAGETIAFGYETPEDVFSAWMASESHRAQILGELFTSVTVGHVEVNGVCYVTAVFIG